VIGSFKITGIIKLSEWKIICLNITITVILSVAYRLYPLYVSQYKDTRVYCISLFALLYNIPQLCV
jgi:hypothetical protein